MLISRSRQNIVQVYISGNTECTEFYDEAQNVTRNLSNGKTIRNVKSMNGVGGGGGVSNGEL